MRGTGPDAVVRARRVAPERQQALDGGVRVRLPEPGGVGQAPRSRCGRTRPRAAPARRRRRRRRPRSELPPSSPGRRGRPVVVAGAVDHHARHQRQHARDREPDQASVGGDGDQAQRDDRTGGPVRSRVTPGRVGDPHRAVYPQPVLRRLLAALLVAGAARRRACRRARTPRVGRRDHDDLRLVDRRPAPAASVTPEPIEWDDCGGVECATVEVPLDYDDPDGEQIELYVARTPASGDRIGALFINPGGPGAEAAEYAELLPVRAPRGDHRALRHRGRRPARRRREHARSTAAIPAEELYGADPTFEDAADEQAYLEVERRVRRGLRGEVRRRARARRHARRRARHGRRARRHGRRAAQLPRLQLRHRDRPGLRRPVPGAGPLDGPRRRRGARTHRARVRPTSRPPASSCALARFVEYCDAAEGCATAGDTLDAVEEVLALPEEPGGIPRRTPAATPGRARRPWGSATRCTRRACGTSLADALAEALDGDGSAPGRAGRRLPRPRRLRGVLRGELPRLRVAHGRPRRLLRTRQGDGRGLAALRRGDRERLRALRRLARAAAAARGGDRAGHAADPGHLHHRRPRHPVRGGRRGGRDPRERRAGHQRGRRAHGRRQRQAPASTTWSTAYLVDGDVPEDGYTCE